MKRTDIVCFIQMINLLLFNFYCLSSVAPRGRGRINYELKMKQGHRFYKRMREVGVLTAESIKDILLS